MSDSVTVSKLPECDLWDSDISPCGPDAHDADFDFRTKFGPWVNGCQRAFEALGVGLGTGKGQRLLLGE